MPAFLPALGVLCRLSARSLTTSAVHAELPGTVPPHHAYIFLHTAHPPSEYPAKFSTPLQRRLLRSTMQWGGTVNFAWVPEGTEGGAMREGEGEQESHFLTAFSNTRGKLEIDNVSLANADNVVMKLEAHARTEPESAQNLDGDIHLYVCTHGARDCRCGETGGAVARAIRNELHRRRERDAADPSVRVKLAEVAHVGGHKHAANVLVYPHGEWLGEVKPDDVPKILDAILERPARPMTTDEMPICPSHWRGRMGMTKEEQLHLFTQLCT